MKTILISLDTMRADRLSCYGYPKLTSPHLDAIAADGVLFERAFAADIPTEVAHTDVFTGRLGLQTGVVSHGSPLTHLSKTVEWLPTIIRKAGYQTAAVDNLYQLKEWFARGYMYYMNSVGGTRWIDGKTVNDLAKEWLSEHHADEFFLFLHYWDPHTPYLPPEKYVPLFYPTEKDPYDPGNLSMEPAYNHRAYPFFKHHHYDLLGSVTDMQYMNALYDAEVRYLDDLLAELDGYLSELGIQEETLLIIFGDHGESLTEHDIYWDHCGLYDTTVHVPLIIRWPDHLPRGHRISGIVQQVDIFPTILEAFHIGVPQGIDGKSLWPLVKGENIGTQSRLFLSECAWQAGRAIRTMDFKLIRTYDSGPFVRPTRELYDLRSDPGEIRNLAECMPEVADEMESALTHWVRETLGDRDDPMFVQLQDQGLPFRRRIEEILKDVGLSWGEWVQNPDRHRFDMAYARRKA